jgi:hypothetical protein
LGAIRWRENGGHTRLPQSSSHPKGERGARLAYVQMCRRFGECAVFLNLAALKIGIVKEPHRRSWPAALHGYN